jgi:hypothetical protein
MEYLSEWNGQDLCAYRLPRVSGKPGAQGGGPAPTRLLIQQECRV